MHITDEDGVQSLGTIMCVGAHPDDETFIAGGILAIAATLGQRVICVTATKGEGGSQDETRWPAETMGQVRSEELAAALKVLGVTQHHWLGYEDGNCEKVDAAEASAQLQKLIAQYQPNTVLTFGPDGLTGHPDHAAVSNWVDTAVADAAIKPRVFHAVITKDQYRHYLQTAHDKLNWFYNIDLPPVTADQDCTICVRCTDEICARKQQAFRAMPSQYGAMFSAFDDDFLAEAFRVEAFVRARG